MPRESGPPILPFSVVVDEGWNHNAHYHSLLLEAVPVPCRRALDVGCGLGAFARRLAARADRVDAIDRDGSVVTIAQERSRGLRNLRCVEADFMTWPEGEYDFVSMIASLHHLPFYDTSHRSPHAVKSSFV